MRNLLDSANEAPVTHLLALGYVTMAFLSGGLDPSSGRLHELGALRGLDVAGGEPWRLLTYSVLHGGIVHLVFNTMMLVWLGPMLERAYGWWRFLVIYLAGALGGAVLFCLLGDPRALCVGGSGALFGMMGAALVRNMRAGRHLFSFLDHDGPRQLIGLIVTNLVLGMLLPGVSNTAHVGGLLGGFAVTFFLLDRGRGPVPRAFALAVAALAFSATWYAVRPVARWDWLRGQAERATDPVARAAWREAEALARSADAGSRKAGRLHRVEPALEPPRGDEAPAQGGNR